MSTAPPPLSSELPEIRELECFVKVSELLHFGRAAEELFLSQPTVSEAVRRLERKIGGALFDRSTRKVALTPLGEGFRSEAHMLLEDLRRSLGKAQGMARQQALSIEVGYSGSHDVELLRVVAELQRRSPGVVASIRVMSTPRLVRQVLKGQMHAGIGWSPDVCTELNVQPLGSTSLVAVVTADHEWAGRESVALQELAAEPLIGWPRSANPISFDRFAAAMDATGEPWTLIGTTKGYDNVAARVLSGFGVAVGFECMLARTPMPGLVCIPISPDAICIDRVLFWRADSIHPALPMLVELAGQRLRST